MTQRRMNSTYSDKIGRDGRVPKNIATDISIKPGMVRQTSGDLHPFPLGQALNDEPLQKTYEGKEVPINPGTQPR
jgi:hypothetical protein